MVNLNKQSSHEPLVRIVKRENSKWWYPILVNMVSILVAIIVCVILVAIVGKNPGAFIKGLFQNSFSKDVYFINFLGYFSPLLMISIGLAFAFKMKFWNIGAEGQFMIGALVACTTGMLLQNTLDPSLTMLIVVLMGTLAGAVFGTVVAVFKVQWGTNETLLTLMFNYIATYIVKYCANEKFFRGRSPFPIYQPLPDNSHMPTIPLGSDAVDITIFIAIAIVVFAFIYNNYSKHGYEISIVGDSINTAKYAGMNVKKIVLRTMFLSSAIIGLAGAMQVTSQVTSYQMSSGITYGFGWTGIIVAWLAKLNPIGIFIITIFITILKYGGPLTAEQLGMSKDFTDVIIGLILFIVIAFDFFINYKVIFRKRKKANNNINDNGINNNVDAKLDENTNSVIEEGATQGGTIL